MEKIQDGKLDMSKKKLEQEPKAVDHENLKNKAEKFLIVGAEKDSNFGGSTIIKTKENGIVKGYAIRQKKDGSLEGNEIIYQPDGSMGAVNQLHESDFDKLKQNGVLESYKGTLATEKSNMINDAKLTMLRMYMQGDKFDPSWNRYPEDGLTNPAEEALKGLSSEHQEQMAIDFFDETIGRNISNNRNAYKVYLIFKSTPFGQKFKELEDKRLKEAGYAGFTL